MSNRFATMSKSGAAKRAAAPATKKPKRLALDDYETPESVTEALRPHIKLRAESKILEPAAGSGRMARVLRTFGKGVKVVTSDIKSGKDFLKRTAPFDGHCFTNPPYKGGLAEAFARQALSLCSGKVGMLMQLDFLAGSRRARGLYSECKPELIAIVPWRIMFIDASTGNPIDGQFFNNAWVVWPEAKHRSADGETKVVWLEDPNVLPFG